MDRGANTGVAIAAGLLPLTGLHSRAGLPRPPASHQTHSGGHHTTDQIPTFTRRSGTSKNGFEPNSTNPRNPRNLRNLRTNVSDLRHPDDDLRELSALQ